LLPIIKPDLVTKKTSYGTVTTYTYYTDKPAADADFNRFYSLLNYGAVPIQSKHLLKSAQSSNGLDNYIYTFDTEGKIMKAVDLQGSFSDSRTFGYDCSH